METRCSPQGKLRPCDEESSKQNSESAHLFLLRNLHWSGGNTVAGLIRVSCVFESVANMPDPQQHPVSSRGLQLFRTIGRRLARSEKKSGGDDSSCGSGNDSKNSQDSSGQSSDISERRLSDEGSSETKTKRVSLQVDTTDSSSERTSSTSRSDIVSALGKVFRNLKIGEKKKNKKKKPQQKSILRRPVPHVYVRGVNGLPQRVPLNRDYYRRAYPAPHSRLRL